VPNQPEEMTNSRLARWLSAETLGSLLLVAVAIGTTYQALASETEVTRKKVDSMEVQQQEMKASLNQVEVDTAVIRNNQVHFKDQLNDQKQKINRILDLLERRG